MKEEKDLQSLLVLHEMISGLGLMFSSRIKNIICGLYSFFFAHCVVGGLPINNITTTMPLEAIICPSILSWNFTKIPSELDSITSTTHLHCDIMDGNFVNNITFGPVVLKDIRSLTSLVLDCHLMVQDPQKWISALKTVGCDSITFHVENGHVSQTIDMIREEGMKVGLAIRPLTKVEAVKEFVDRVDLILVMTVEPGFGGQALIEECLDKGYLCLMIRYWWSDE
jgi:ribulose-phosphate 3-epimerase